MESMDDPVKSRFLSLFPEGTQITGVQSYRPGYAFYPARVSIQTPDGLLMRYVVKKSGEHERIAQEAKRLRALTEVGVPVPDVLAHFAGTAEGKDDSLIVMTELAGKALPSIGVVSLNEADLTCRLIIEGVGLLQGLTKRVLAHPFAADLPRHTLRAELEGVVRDAGDWGRVDLFAEAVELLSDSLPRIPERLVFSSGDYNPLNFLTDGEKLTGFVDFEAACFEDPHIGFAKFVIWSADDFGWGMGRKAGLVERYLYSQNVSRQEFAPRLALRCLRHMLTEVAVEGGDAAHREHRFRILSSTTEDLRHI